MDKTFLLFDLDGTLTDPFEGIKNSFRHAFEKTGMNIPVDDGLRWVIGPPLRESIKRLGVPEERGEEILTAFREYFVPTGLYENRPYDGIERLLRDLRNKGHVLALATSKVKEYAEKVLERFKLAEYFSFVGGAELDGSRSEKAEVIKYVMENLKISGKDGVYIIGDREHDVKGAKKTGIKSVGVLWGYGDEQELTNAGADYIIRDMDGLRELFNAG
ncbi:MAG: HAD-IA family hydrolase [Oscillospiraceae bacterium]|jgi:phosphoglycolate phosphatase|nr:HAD-IA family hydrolase [Oscillospiraceae bacterium]